MPALRETNNGGSDGHARFSRSRPTGRSPPFFGLGDGKVACTGFAAPIEQVEAAGPQVVRIGRPVPPRSDIEAWNIGLITAYRRELTPAENEARDAELRTEIRRCFGLLYLRGRYIESYGSPCARPTDEHAYLVIGNDDDSGNLKGLLRKYGRKYDQDSVIHKGYYRDAHLHALRNLPRLGMNDRDAKSVGRFHLSRLGVLYTLMNRCGACGPSIVLNYLQSRRDGVDWLGGRWDDIGLWTPKSFFSRVERRVVFDEAGNRQTPSEFARKTVSKTNSD
jgi:hypothetical protein